jgi:hypothetical protein
MHSSRRAEESGRFNRESERRDAARHHKEQRHTRSDRDESLAHALKSMRILEKSTDSTFDIKPREHIATIAREEAALLTEVPSALTPRRVRALSEYLAQVQSKVKPMMSPPSGGTFCPPHPPGGYRIRPASPRVITIDCSVPLPSRTTPRGPTRAGAHCTSKFMDPMQYEVGTRRQEVVDARKAAVSKMVQARAKDAKTYTPRERTTAKVARDFVPRCATALPADHGAVRRLTPTPKPLHF